MSSSTDGMVLVCGEKASVASFGLCSFWSALEEVFFFGKYFRLLYVSKHLSHF